MWKLVLIFRSGRSPDAGNDHLMDVFITIQENAGGGTGALCCQHSGWHRHAVHHDSLAAYVMRDIVLRSAVADILCRKRYAPLGGSRRHRVRDGAQFVAARTKLGAERQTDVAVAEGHGRLDAHLTYQVCHVVDRFALILSS